MFDRRHPLGWLFYLLIATLASAQKPTTSTVSEVRWTDFGWGKDNDRNLAGRFSTGLLTWRGWLLCRIIFCASSTIPCRRVYSRYTTAWHLKFPL